VSLPNEEVILEKRSLDESHGVIEVTHAGASGFPVNLAFDHILSKLYWSDPFLYTIESLTVSISAFFLKYSSEIFFDHHCF